jgi:hypothetical protein
LCGWGKGVVLGFPKWSVGGFVGHVVRQRWREE